MPFSAARGLLTTILCKSVFEWRVLRIHVLSPIVFCAPITRNEHKADGSHTQCKTIYLRNPEYVIEAQIEHGGPVEPSTNPSKFVAMFERYRDRGSQFKPSFLGLHECMAYAGTPPTGWRERAARANPGHDPFLGRMPLRVEYDENKAPVKTTFANFVFDAITGSYGPMDTP